MNSSTSKDRLVFRGLSNRSQPYFCNASSSLTFTFSWSIVNHTLSGSDRFSSLSVLTPLHQLEIQQVFYQLLKLSAAVPTWIISQEKF